MNSKHNTTIIRATIQPSRIVRLQELCARTGYSRSMVFEKTSPNSKYYDPSFPRRIPLGARAMGFLESEIDTWIQSRINQADQKSED